MLNISNGYDSLQPIDLSCNSNVKCSKGEDLLKST